MAGDVWRDLKMQLRKQPEAQISESDRRIDFSDGGMIAIRSTHYPDTLRGAGLDFAVLDEAAFMDSSIWSQIIRPMLLERKGGALFISTPYGRNWFWQLFQTALDPEEYEWAAFQLASSDNMFIDEQELENIRRNTPDRVFREEYLAQFIADAGQVFRGIEDAATAQLKEQPIAGRRYMAGIDWGRDHDYTCIVVIDVDKGQMVDIDRFNQISWDLQRGRLKAICEKWQPASVWAEKNSIGSVNIEALQNEGLPIRPFQTTASSKRPLIEALSLAIERGDIAVLPDPVLLGELAAYSIERLPGGGYRYSAPPGGHDDTVIATALAWHGVLYGSVRIDFV
jgi:hypothetical protein